MSADIILSLQLEKHFENGRVIVAKEMNSCDSSFITSCILGHTIKNKVPVLLVLLHNSLPHYQNIGLKMFYNLNKSVDSGLVHVYDLAKESRDILLGVEQTPLSSVTSKIKDKITEIHETFGSVNVIVDGVSHLLDMQFKINEVNQFCVKIARIIWSISNSFVLFHCNVASDDDYSYVMSNVLCHLAHTVLEVESLSSGWSADVSGHLRIFYTGIKFDEKNACILDLKPSQYLFKLFDKGVKLFAPGTV